MAKTVAEILDMAIQREELAYDFYMDIHRQVDDAGVKDTVEFIAGEEKKHKAFLVSYKEGKYGADALRLADVVEYKLAEYLDEPEISKNSSSEEIYLVAAHREGRSHQFYSELDLRINLAPSLSMYMEGDLEIRDYREPSTVIPNYWELELLP